MDLLLPTSSSVIIVDLPRKRTNAKKSAMSKPKCHKIIAETGSGRPYPKITAIITARPLTHHFVTVKSMFTKKSLFNIFYIRKRKPESDTDLRDDTQVKQRKFCPKWLEEFQWLKYD